MRKVFLFSLSFLLSVLLMVSCSKDNSTNPDSGVTVTDIDGNVYQTVQIGSQIWMAENLKVTHYRNGEFIYHLADNENWTYTWIGAYCVYDNDPSNADTFGYLYNWYTIDDPRGLAPEGWHVPTDVEIMELEMALGMSYSEAHDYGIRGTNEGSKLAGRQDLWSDGALERNPEFSSSGLNILPGGRRFGDTGSYISMSEDGYFWASTQYNGNTARFRVLYYNYSEISRYAFNKRNGFYVRCIKD